MSTTLTARPPRPDEVWSTAGDDVRRTAVVGLGTVLAFAPLFVIFTDWTWFFEGIGAALCVLVPALLLRGRTVARSAQLLPGLVVLVLYATALYLKAFAIAGLIPDVETWHRLVTVRETAAQQISDNVSPLRSTPELRTFVIPGLGVFTALVDWYAVVRRAPALAGVPLLALFTICGAIAGTTVGWMPFTASAAGFLLILSADSRINLLAWGRIVPRRSGDRTARARLGLSGRRIGVIAVVLAVLVPAALPGLSRNLLADAFHGRGGGSGGNGTSISPFASLKGELNQGEATVLAEVTVDPGVTPYFLRSKVLDEFTGSGWIASSSFRGRTPSRSALAQAQPTGGTVKTYSATVKIEGLRDSAPILAAPADFDGLRSTWEFSPSDGTLGGSKTRNGDTYTEQVVEPTPTSAELATAGDAPEDLNALTVLPTSFPASVRQTVAQLTDGDTTPYERARDLYNFFRDPANNFVYSLQTKAGDSGDDLVDFLQGRSGYCQQYAAALAVMMRVAGIPTRVVLGYTHGAPDANGRFEITSRDAHAWVEGYFGGFGWLPFNPTPLVGSDAARNVEVPYLPSPGASQTTTSAPSTTSATAGGSSATANRRETEDRNSEAAAAAATSSGTGSPLLPGWAVWTLVAAVAVVLIVLALPALRLIRRRALFRSAVRSGRLEPLWQELAANAMDSGAAWPDSTTPRQVPHWLRERGVPVGGAVETLAANVERERYAPVAAGDQGQRATHSVSDAIEGVQAAARAMRAPLSRRARLHASLLPASVTARWRPRQPGGTDTNRMPPRPDGTSDRIVGERTDAATR